MLKKPGIVFGILLVFVGILFFSFLAPSKSNNEVIIYVSHDQDYSQPVLEAFEKQTGITVRAVYDTEASKTVGLTNRLIAEKQNPQADVFWNNEVLRTIQLKKEGVLAPYTPDNFETIDPLYKDPEGYWTGFAARARVLIVNTTLLSPEKYPSSLEDLTQPEFADSVTLADPRFGTTGSHLAALRKQWGKEPFERYLRTLKKQHLDIAQSNGQTRDKVAAGEKAVGFTDTDDVNDALIDKKPVAMIYPDQGEGQIGTLIIPNTAMLIRGAKNPDHAKQLINFLISAETESRLAHMKSAQMPLLPNVDRPSHVPDVRSIKAMNIRWEDISEHLTPVLDFAQETML